jgi:alpha-mannosidase
MQKYSKLLIVLPCHSLEDFPIHHRGSEAANLLANWTALWHPALIASCEHKPVWQQADNPVELFVDPFDADAEQVNGAGDRAAGICLALIPTIAESMIDSELLQNLEKHNAVVISDQSSRSQIIQLAIEANDHAKTLTANLDGELAKDFLALGYAFLQTQIMTRQLRYSSNLDEAYFSEAVVGAAKLATAGKTEPAQEALVRCFDLLLEEKNGYYPVEPELIDIVLTAHTTLGKSLERQLDVDHPLNVLLTGSNGEKLVQDRPETAAKLKKCIEEERVTLIGGLEDELPDSLIATESTLHQLILGRAAAKKQFDVEPLVFMRRRFGLTSATPGLLDQLKFLGAIHATLDDGKFPNSSSCNIRWTGDDNRSVLAIGDLPLSAADAGSFVGLGVRLGEAIDSAHIAAAVFVHWPGDTCESFEDLIRISNYGPLFGNFIGLNEYFDSVYDPGYGDTYAADEYKPPFLSQAVKQESPRPISRFTKYWERFYKLSAARALLTQACAKSGLDQPRVEEFQDQFGELQSAIESALNVTAPNDDDIDSQLESLHAKLKLALHPNPASNEDTHCVELVNPTSFRRQVELKASFTKIGALKQVPPVFACDSSRSGSHWVIELPPMGSTVIDLATPDSNDVLKSDPKIGEELILRNEFFELHVDENTGGIRSIQLYRTRVNLASQQLAIRIAAQPDARDQPLTRARYTRMVADEVNLAMESRLAGTITSKGRLLDSDAVVAEFEQSIRVVRGQRVIEIEVEVNPTQPLSNSVNHYVCSRIAWKSEASRIVANAGETRQEINSDWFHATNFIDVVQDDNRLTMLTGGLPFHRRTSRRMVDSVLIVGNERQRRFRFGLGVNVPYAMAAAVEWFTPASQINTAEAGEGKNSTSWLFHFDCKNILVTWWHPFFESQPQSDQPQWAGVQIRLRETEGRSGKLNIRCPRPIASGEQVNFVGETVRSLAVAEDDAAKLIVEFGRFDYFQILIRWKT